MSSGMVMVTNLTAKQSCGRPVKSSFNYQDMVLICTANIQPCKTASRSSITPHWWITYFQTNVFTKNPLHLTYTLGNINTEEEDGEEGEEEEFNLIRMEPQRYKASFLQTVQDMLVLSCSLSRVKNGPWISEF